MVLITRLGGEDCTIELYSLGWVVQRDEDPITGLDFFFMLDTVKYIAGIVADDLLSIYVNVSIYQRLVRKAVYCAVVTSVIMISYALVVSSASCWPK